MSMIPSLSVWSSIKLPFPKCSYNNKIKKPYSVESCDNFIKRNYEKSRAERAPEMVSLRVPGSLNIDKENSVPNLYCECTRSKKKSTKSKKKNRHIRFVTVPEIIFYEKECAISAKKFLVVQNANFKESEKGVVLQDNDEEDKSEEFEKKPDEIGSIPSVKPWTLEELVEINRQKEEAKKRVEIKKNKTRENIIENPARVLETSNRFSLPDKNLALSRNPAHCDISTCFNKHHNVYHSKLGLNSGDTLKVHKPRWECE